MRLRFSPTARAAAGNTEVPEEDPGDAPRIVPGTALVPRRLAVASASLVPAGPVGGPVGTASPGAVVPVGTAPPSQRRATAVALPAPPAQPMRLGVIDIGSNTVHLLVVDAHHGAAPRPAASARVPLRLVELLDGGGALSVSGEHALIDCIRDLRRQAEELAVFDLVAFATSALRDATNSDEVLARLRSVTGVAVEVLPGEDEARLTFLAVRRWLGWSAGRLLAMDIGGGSLEIGAGMDEEPDVVASLPLGASRLTRDWLPTDPPSHRQLAELRRYVRAQIAPVVGKLYHVGEPTRAVATSKTFRSLARIAGAEPYSRGPYVRRVLRRTDLEAAAKTVCRMPSAVRVSLPGVSASRAGQLAAGAVVAVETMDLLSVDEVEICPWALREGIILRRLDTLNFG
ncbi:MULTISPECIES: Ppx/GppA phosphatase family protein [unclassified Pseudofrankia]|uniref:Ppx/GppA phosphatase family protein n=1 Tax=unclassified Pseudofrankia TaxID=2994372 RepID=UPI0009F51B11|nr:MULTISPECIES: Ppx/GppA phosphatase family protein [unclassified Pseudofrankia]MDT3438660.1 Ppx/GppA phosphatase family protein [Pseudofrankia sp. BMG5.37]